MLEVRVGKGLASKGFPIIVEDMQFSGRMKFKIKLQIPFPHIEKLDVCFLEPPEFDYALKPVGGDLFGVDIGFLPGLNSFIREMVHANLGPMFYAPNVFTVELAKMMAGAPTDTAIGVLQVTLHRAHGLKNSDKFSGTPDPYATISLNDRAVLAKTKTIHESADPRWNETKFILINNFNDPLTINVFDYNDIRKDKELGKATFALDVLEKDPVHENLTLEVISNNKTRGQVVADVKFFPVMKPIVLEDGTIEPVPETNTGILRYTIHQCKDLDGSKSMVGALSPYAIPYVNDKALPQTKIMKRTNNPIWGEVRELIVGNRSTAKLAIRIKDDRGLQADPVLGEYKVGLDDLMERMAKGQDWFDLAGVKTGRVKITAEWKPVELKGALGGSGGYVTPIGVMRVHLLNARGLKNLEAMGKSDPYVRILLSGIEKRRSVTFYNDLNPDWDEILYVPVHNTKEKITLEVMDEEKMGKDRSLGHLDVLCADYIKQAENGEYLAHDDNEMKSDNLVYGAKKTPKGKLNYSVSFFPCVNVADAEEEGEKKEATSGDASPVVSGSTTPGPMTPGPITPVTGRKSGESSQETLSVDSAPAAGEAASADAADLVADVKAEAAQAAADGPPKVKLTPDELLRHGKEVQFVPLINFPLIQLIQIAVLLFSRSLKEASFIKIVILRLSWTIISTHHTPQRSDRRCRRLTIVSLPCFSSDIHTKRFLVGEAVVRELEWSKITLRIREDNKKEAEGDDEDHFIGRLKGNTFDTLKQCLNNPTVLTLRGKDGENKVKISLKYIPIQMKLDPRESVNNMGTLRVDVLDASNLPAADRNGKSDPYCTFELNDEKVFKSKVQKKTLHPAWNEFFETKIASRTAADFKISVYDWDMAGDDDFLGQSPINLSALEPFKQTLVNLKLRGKRGEVGDYGEVRLRFMFRSDYVTRSRQGSSTFGGTFAVPGKIVAAGAAVPLKGVGLAAGGVMKGASFLKNGFSRKSKEESISGLDPEELRQIEESSKAVAGEKDVGLVVPEGMADKYASASDDERGNRLTRSLTPSKNRSVTPTGFGSPHGRTKSINSVYSTSGSPSPGAEAGRATIRLISATGFPSSANVQARIRLAGKSKDLYKSKGIKGGNVNWDETTSIACTADQQFLLKIIDDHFIRGDKDLGETMFVLDDTGAGVEKEVAVGEGRVKFKAVFTAGSQASPDVSKKKKRNGLLRRV